MTAIDTRARDAVAAEHSVRPGELLITADTPAPGLIVVGASGELNPSTAEQLDAAFRRALAAAPFAIVVDLDVVPFLGWGGVSVLDALRRECLRRGVTLRWVTRSVATSRMLHRAGLDRVSVIGCSRTTAIDECGRMRRRPRRVST